ncbi:MAG: hypothetical protein COX02_02005 [Candidatus Vogelbacteria bacterium CG22_combo_CG10-13_8_21_14_all_37_9]|uniref:Cell division protein FtsX n=1 Tax=Candidatus Vogelbacteria bacterium CG22_combo_CG10-13_8_21_14_all_37_9 TaxID=1975046 RepID=A0A2H0BKC4_9BACT|nr:MAG: hypothetical protein BK005_02175 [bacterium CG10_37_50]PIP58127.1 MAG: hypothetical protein COX02_02005 [Candidatus Vogelbacteria bacterium CG22_combo_CG10-13_8_21_14_all_37_9]
MIWINLKRILYSGFVNFWRNGLVSLASVLAITVSLYTIGALMIGSAFLNGIIDEIKTKVDISISFKSTADTNEIEALKKSLEALAEVKEVTLITREEEYEAFKQRHQDNALLLQSLDEVGNPFGARINVRALDPAQYESIANFLNNEEGSLSVNRSIIDQISFKKDIVDRLSRIIALIKRVGLVISTVMICLAIFATFNTITLAIYISREEISVMRLVGAGNVYVKGPFLVEGLTAGFLGTLLALFGLYPSVAWVKATTINVFGGIDLVSYYISNFPMIFLVLLSSGLALGFIASYLAVRRYTRI